MAGASDECLQFHDGSRAEQMPCLLAMETTRIVRIALLTLQKIIGRSCNLPFIMSKPRYQVDDDHRRGIDARDVTL